MVLIFYGQDLILLLDERYSLFFKHRNMLLIDFDVSPLFLSDVNFLFKHSHLGLNFLVELGPLLEHVDDGWE